MPFPSPMRESEVTQLCPTSSDSMDHSLPGFSVHGIPSMGFSRQEYWSGVPLPSLLSPGSSLQGGKNKNPDQIAVFLGDGLEVAYTLLLPTSHWSKFNHWKTLANL